MEFDGTGSEKRFTPNLLLALKLRPALGWDGKLCCRYMLPNIHRSVWLSKGVQGDRLHITAKALVVRSAASDAASAAKRVRRNHERIGGTPDGRKCGLCGELDVGG
jgi:hypothetical protein